VIVTSTSGIDAILARHRIAEPWRDLPATGVANRIVATHLELEELTRFIGSTQLASIVV
jgi:hypothetical protein